MTYDNIAIFLCGFFIALAGVGFVSYFSAPIIESPVPHRIYTEIAPGTKFETCIVSEIKIHGQTYLIVSEPQGVAITKE